MVQGIFFVALGARFLVLLGVLFLVSMGLVFGARVVCFYRGFKVLHFVALAARFWGLVGLVVGVLRACILNFKG